MKMDGDYPDEMILSAIKKYELALESEKPLEYQIRIQNKTVELSDRRIYPDIMMRLPKYFTAVSGDETAKGYLFSNHPEIIYTSGCGTVNFTFDRIERQDTQQIRADFLDLLRQRYPQNTIYDVGQDDNWFDYKSFAADSDIYNLLFIFSYGDKSVVGTFKCAFRYYADWKHYVLKMLETIQYKAEEVCIK